MRLTARERALLEALLPRLDAATAAIALRLLGSEITTGLAGPTLESASEILQALLARRQSAHHCGTQVHGLADLIDALQRLPGGTGVVRHILATADVVGSFYRLEDEPGCRWESGLGLALVDVATEPAPLH